MAETTLEKRAADASADVRDGMMSLEEIERRTYQIIAFGFPLLTLVIITGAVWAQYAWQRWWRWDPKETSALVAWIIYAAYLHGRTQRGWRGSTSAGFAVAGFAAILFCWAGINMLPGSLHSYGAPTAMGSLGGWEGMGAPEKLLTQGYLFAYLLAMVAYVGAMVSKSKAAGQAGTLLTSLGLLAQTGSIIVRTVEAQRLPFTSGYDFAVCFVWGIVVCYLVLERITKARSVGAPALALALIVSMYAYLWYPQKGIQPLPPALQNKFWLHVHVALAIVAYGALALGCATGAQYFIKARRAAKQTT